MSEPIPESIPTSADPRSKRPLKKRQINAPATSQQASQITALFSKPDVEIPIPPSSSSTSSALAKSAIGAPPEIVQNVQGSSAGAGSGEFHVYKASRRREFERVRGMEEEMERERDRIVWEREREERRVRDEEVTRRNRERRERKRGKGKNGGKNGGKSGGGMGSGDDGVEANGNGDKHEEGNGEKNGLSKTNGGTKKAGVKANVNLPGPRREDTGTNGDQGATPAVDEHIGVIIHDDD